jgi:predicted nucleic acid-binding Zn ribbon protein
MQRIDRILDSIVQSMGLEKRLEENKVLTLWEEAVGRNIAMHTRPVKIKGSRLFVSADSASWRTELTFLKPEIIRRLNAMSGKVVVEEIVFVAGAADQTRE